MAFQLRRKPLSLIKHRFHVFFIVSHSFLISLHIFLQPDFYLSSSFFIFPLLSFFLYFLLLCLSFSSLLYFLLSPINFSSLSFPPSCSLFLFICSISPFPFLSLFLPSSLPCSLPFSPFLSAYLLSIHSFTLSIFFLIYSLSLSMPIFFLSSFPSYSLSLSYYNFTLSFSLVSLIIVLTIIFVLLQNHRASGSSYSRNKIRIDLLFSLKMSAFRNRSKKVRDLS